MESFGADLSKIFVEGGLLNTNEDGKQSIESVTFSNTVEIEAAAAALGDCRLIVIDPLSAFLGNIDSHKNSDVRALLAPLAKVGANLGATILLVSHLNKSSGGSPINRITGSGAFGAAARSVWGICKDSDDESRRLFLPIKANLGPDSTGLAYRVVANGVGPTVRWEDGPVTITATDAMGQSMPDDIKYERDEAKDWLLDMLSMGSVSAKDLQKDASAAGISWATVRRAKAELKVESFKSNFSGGWRWRLTEDAHNTPVNDSGEHLREEITNKPNEYAGSSEDAQALNDERLGERLREQTLAQDAHEDAQRREVVSSLAETRANTGVLTEKAPSISPRCSPSTETGEVDPLRNALQSAVNRVGGNIDNAMAYVTDWPEADLADVINNSATADHVVQASHP